MRKKSAHPGMKLFDHLNGRLDERAGRMIEQHLDSCDECSSIAGLVRSLKAEAQDERFDASAAHPDTSELASFFYAGSKTRSEKVAAHVALCRSCAGELALYARAEQAASSYDSSEVESATVPAAAWEMIRDWRESSFARPKPEIGWTSAQAIEKLSQSLSERKDELRELATRALERREKELESASFHADEGSQKAGLVPVIILDRSAQFRGVEMFEWSSGPHGASILKHPEKSHRFDNKQFHALLDFGEESFVVVSDLIEQDEVRLQRVTRPNGPLRRADYFIIED